MWRKNKYPNVPPRRFREMIGDYGVSQQDLLSLFPITAGRIDDWCDGVDRVPPQFWWIMPLLSDQLAKRQALAIMRHVTMVGPEKAQIEEARRHVIIPGRGPGPGIVRGEPGR